MKTAEDFAEKYGELHDAVIKSVSLVYHPFPVKLVITVVVDCMAITRDDEWVRLKIDFYDIDEFSINSKENFSFEIVEGFSVFHHGNKILFNFYPGMTTPETLMEHRESMFYIMANNIDFTEVDFQ